MIAASIYPGTERLPEDPADTGQLMPGTAR